MSLENSQSLKIIKEYNQRLQAHNLNNLKEMDLFFKNHKLQNAMNERTNREMEELQRNSIAIKVIDIVVRFFFYQYNKHLRKGTQEKRQFISAHSLRGSRGQDQVAPLPLSQGSVVGAGGAVCRGSVACWASKQREQLGHLGLIGPPFPENCLLRTHSQSLGDLLQAKEARRLDRTYIFPSSTHLEQIRLWETLRLIFKLQQTSLLQIF